MSKKSSLEARLFESLKPLHIQNYQLLPYKIPLNMPWQSASGSLHYRQGLLVKLIINETISVIGECAPITEIGTESLQQAQIILEKKLAAFQGKAISEALLEDMAPFPASRFALETALLSLLEQHTGKNVAQLLSPHYNHTIKTNAMLGILDDQLLYKAKQAESDGFTCLKIKLGLGDIATEAKAVFEMLQQLTPSTQIRIDANKSWTYEQTKWFLDYLKAKLTNHLTQIDSIEEPLLKFNIEQYQSLQNNTSIDLALDESFSERLNWTRFPVRRLILKPTAQGGIIKTWQLVKQAEQYNIKTIITSSIETGYGLWPISYLCGAVNASQTDERIHGLATASWLEDTLTAPPEIKHGHIVI